MALTPVVVKDGNGATQSMDALQDAAGINISLIGLDSTRATYRASAQFTPTLASALALITIRGSASKTVRIKRIGVTCVGAANPSFEYSLIRTTTVGTGGTAVAPTVGKLDTNSAAATAVIQHYTTAAQSQGAANGVLSNGVVQGTLASGTTNTVAPAPMTQVFPEFGVPAGQAIVLRGATDNVEISNVLPATLITVTNIAYFVEWEEDNS